MHSGYRAAHGFVLALALLGLSLPAAAFVADGGYLDMLGGACGSADTKALAALPDAAPGAKVLAKRLAQIEADYAASHDVERVSRLKQAFAKGGPGELGGMLYLTGHLHAAIYSFAEAARRAPDNAAALANLGAALSDAGDYSGAVAVLRAALERQPGNAIAASNLAIVYARLGDRSTAIPMLQASIKRAPAQLEANLTLAHLYTCEHKPRQALLMARQAQRVRPTDRARHIVIDTVRTIGKPDGWADDQGFPEPSPTGPAPELVPPKLPQSVTGYNGRWALGLQRASLRMTKKSAALLAQANAVGIGNIPDSGLTAQQLAARVLEHSLETQTAPHVFYLAQTARLHHFLKLAEVYSDKITRVSDKLAETDIRLDDQLIEVSDHAEEAANNAPPKQALKAWCAVLRGGHQHAYDIFRPAYQGAFADTAALIGDYYRRTNALLREFVNPDDARALDLWRRSQVLDWEADLYGEAVGSALYLVPQCGRLQTVPAKAKPEKLKPGKGGDCHYKYGFDISVFKMSIDCNKVEISGGEGLIGTLDWDYRRRVGTVYLGFGVHVGAQVGAVGLKSGPKLGGQIGFTATFDGDSGNLIDGGMYTQAEAEIFGSAVTAGPNPGRMGEGIPGKVGGELKFTWRIANGFNAQGQGEGF